MYVICFVFTGDELFTDSCGDRIRRNGLLYEVDCLYAKESLGIDESKIGANASAEEAEEGVEDASVQGLDVIIQNRLQKGAPHDKKTYAVIIHSIILLYTTQLAGTKA